MRNWLQRRKLPELPAEQVLAGLSVPRFPRLRLEHFPVGIDKRLIDVALGPALAKAVSLYVDALVRESAQEIWKEPRSQSTSEVLAETFRAVLREHARSVVEDARGSNRLERVQLFQLALWKLALARIDDSLAALRQELDERRNAGSRDASGRRLRDHELTVLLGRHAASLRYRTARNVVRQLMRVEHGGLRNLRQSVLGQPWPVAEEMLDNPVLQLDGIGRLRDFAAFYPVCLHELDIARGVTHCLFNALGQYLPENAALPGRRSTEQRASEAGSRPAQAASHGLLEARRWARCLLDDAELGEGAGPSWLDEPGNAAALLGGIDGEWPRPGAWPKAAAVEPLQRALNRRFLAELERAGLWRGVVAAYRLAEIYPSLGLRDGERLVFEFLRGDFGRRELERRLETLGVHRDPAVLARRLEGLRREGGEQPREVLAARLAADVLRLRRDLKLAVRAYRAMERIRLLGDPQELLLSRDQKVLQLFCREEPAGDRRGSITGHVVIAVEIRGAVRITAEMRRRNLNPSAYFSRYFFDPVEKIRLRFGAHKIGADGERMTLVIADYGGDGVHRLAVARACCFARGLVAQLGALNAEAERVGLSPLEIGIGIAYAEEAPTYLYDQSRRVVVSPAIAHAARLAACHLPLREECPLPEGHTLCVANAVGAASAVPGQDEALLRLNINGIELDATAFAQLNVELALRKLRLREREGRRPVQLYAGQCPDNDGRMHWLVIREQVVKLWMGGQLLENRDEGRSYFEVVGDRKMIERVVAGIGRASVQGQTAGVARQ